MHQNKNRDRIGQLRNCFHTAQAAFRHRGSRRFLALMQACLLAALAAHSSGSRAGTPDETPRGSQGPLLAQSQTAPSGTASSSDAELESIVVTGSRIARRDFESNTPIVTISQDQLQISSSTQLGSVLQQLPQFTSETNTSISTGPGGGGLATADLRGLGAERTLVLLDGHRIVPQDGFGHVDLNLFPQSLIGNVEVITGGASAVYGADAVAGVVNILLKKDLDGLMLQADGGATQRGDSGTSDFTASWGGKTADNRGHFLVSFSAVKDDYSQVGFNRPFLDNGAPNIFPTGAIIFQNGNLPSNAALANIFRSDGIANPAGANTSQFLNVNPATGQLFQETGPPINCPWNGQLLPTDISSTPLVHTSAAAVSTCGAITSPLNQLQPAVSRYSTLDHADYKITDSVTAYGDVLFVHNVVDNFSPGGLSFGLKQGILIPYTNPFVPAQVATLYASAPVQTGPSAVINMSGNSAALAGTGYTDTTDTYDVYQFTGGVRGSFGTIPLLRVDDWTWDVYTSIGKTQDQTHGDGYASYTRMEQLANAPDGGASICAGGYNFFDLAATSQACKNYVSTSTTNVTTLTQNITEADLQGGLFKLPAGRLRFALGVDYRYEGYDLQMDSQAIPNAQGLYEASGTPSSPPSSGHLSVREAYLELLAPIISDVPFVKSLDLDGAVRASDYTLSGEATTWKVDATWKLDNWIAFRGGFEHAIKEPSVSDLFSGLSVLTLNLGTTQQGLGDPCDINSVGRKGPNANAVRTLCLETGVPSNLIDTYTYSAGGILGGVSGNSGLQPETANTITVGTVLTPQFEPLLLQKLSATIDYYNIDVANAVGALSVTTLVQSCYNLNGQNPSYSPTNPDCLLLQRVPGQGSLTNVVLPTENLANYKTAGIDAQVDWHFPLEAIRLPPRAGDVGLNVATSYTELYKIQTLATNPAFNYVGTIGNGQIDAGAISHPRWKINTTFSYHVDDVFVSLRARFISAMSNSGNVGVTTVAPGIGSITYFDFLGKWQVSPIFEVRFGVSNLLDSFPPVWTGFGATDPATYDTFGRRFFAGFNVKV